MSHDQVSALGRAFAESALSHFKSLVEPVYQPVAKLSQPDPRKSEREQAKDILESDPELLKLSVRKSHARYAHTGISLPTWGRAVKELRESNEPTTR